MSISSLLKKQCELTRSAASRLRSTLDLPDGILEQGLPIALYLDRDSDFHETALSMYEEMRKNLPESMHIPAKWVVEKEVCAPLFMGKWLPRYSLNHTTQQPELVMSSLKTGDKVYVTEAKLIDEIHEDGGDASVFESEVYVRRRPLMSPGEWRSRTHLLQKELVEEIDESKVITAEMERLSSQSEPIQDADIYNALLRIQSVKDNNNNNSSSNISNVIEKLVKCKMSDDDIKNSLSELRNASINCDATTTNTNTTTTTMSIHTLTNDPHNGVNLDALAHYIGDFLVDKGMVTCFPRFYWCGRILPESASALPEVLLVTEYTHQTMRHAWEEAAATKDTSLFNGYLVLADIAQICFNLARCQRLFGFYSGNCTIDSLESRPEGKQKRMPIVWNERNFSLPCTNIWKFVDLSQSAFVFQGVRYVSQWLTMSDVPHGHDLYTFAASAIELLERLLLPEDDYRERVLHLLRSWIECGVGPDASKQILHDMEMQVTHEGLSNKSQEYFKSILPRHKCPNSIPHLQMVEFDVFEDIEKSSESDDEDPHVYRYVHNH